MTEIKEMPFLVMKHTLVLIYFKIADDFRIFHSMKMIKVPSNASSCFDEKQNEKHVIFDDKTDIIFHVFQSH